MTRTMARVTRSATTSYPSPMYKRGRSCTFPTGLVRQCTSRTTDRTVALVQSSRCGDTPSRIVVRIALGTTTQCGTNASVPQKFEDCFNTNSNLRITVPHDIDFLVHLIGNTCPHGASPLVGRRVDPRVHAGCSNAGRRARRARVDALPCDALPNAAPTREHACTV